LIEVADVAPETHTMSQNVSDDSHRLRSADDLGRMPNGAGQAKAPEVGALCIE
jgi:hypothetical protein